MRTNKTVISMPPFAAALTPPASNPLFGTYANIRYAIDGRRQIIEWCEWREGELLEGAGITATGGRRNHA